MWSLTQLCPRGSDTGRHFDYKLRCSVRGVDSARLCSTCASILKGYSVADCCDSVGNFRENTSPDGRKDMILSFTIDVSSFKSSSRSLEDADRALLSRVYS